MIPAAEAFINNWTGRAWELAAQSLEAHYAPDYLLMLGYFPVASVSAVKGRAGLGETETDLTEGTDYEVRDLESGIVYIVSPGSYDRIRVTYTPETAVPADITLACAEIVANWMQPALRPGSYGLDSYSLPDLSVKFARSHVQETAPPMATAILNKYTIPVQA